MGQTVKLRRSAISGKIPINSQLLLGELSMNTTDGKIFLSKSGSNGPSVEEVIITNTQNFGSIDIVGSISGSFLTGSFIGDGSGLYNISASGVTGLNLDRISNSTSTASIDADGLHINTDTTVTGSLTATEFTGSALGLTNVPIKISGSDAGSTSIDSTFTRIKFDDTTGIKVSGTTGGDAIVFLSGVAAESDGGEGKTAKLEVTSATSTWTLNHNLNEQHPSIEVFDSNNEVIIPQKIDATSVNQVVVSFASPQTGVVTATVGGGLPSIESGYENRVLSVGNDGIASWKTGILSGSIDFSTLVDTGSFNTYTSSNDSTNTTQNSRLGSLEGFTASIDDTYATDSDVTTLRGDLNTYTSSTDGRLDSLETTSGSSNLRLDYIESVTSSHHGRLNSLETISSSHDGRLDSLETTSGSHDTRLTDLESFETNVDGGLEFTGSNVTIKGNLLVKGTETRVDSTTVDIDDNIISLNGSGAANAGIEVRDTESPGILSGSLIYDTGDNVWKGGIKGSEKRLLDNDDLTSLDGRLDELESNSGSNNDRLDRIEISTSSLNSFTSSIDTTIKTKIDTEGVISGSIQIDHDATTNFSSNEHIDHSTITIGSGKGLTGGGTIDTSRSLTLDTGSIHFLGGIKSKLNTETVVSGSVQIDITGTTNYNLVDGRLDSIESFTSSIDDTYATDADVTTLRGDLNTYTSSNDSTNTTQDGRLDSLESNSGSYLTDYNDEYTTGATFNGSNGIVTFTRNDGDQYTVDISTTLTDVNVTGGTYNDGNQTLTLNKSNGGSVDVTGFAVDTVLHTTGATFNSSDGVVTFTKNSGGTYTVDLDGRYLTSFTETDPIFTASPSAGITETNITNWDSAYTYSQVGHLPLSGGTITGDVRFLDDDQLKLGSGNDLRLWHNGTNSYVFNYNGDLNVGSRNGDLKFLGSDGITGEETYFFLDGSQRNINFQRDAIFTDNKKVLFGGSGDLQIYHDGTDSYIDDSGTGDLRIRSNFLKIEKYTGETMATFNDDNAVTLYYNNSAKLETTSAGVTVSGTIVATGYNDSNWNTAYGWGDHSQVGYITGFTNTNEFTTGATFNSGNGVITFTRNNGGDTFTVDLDGRYLTSYTETDTLDSVTDRGATTNNDLTVGGLTISDTFPYLDFVDTNSFTDTADRFRVRAGGNNGQIQWSDSSAGTTTTLMTFLPDGKITMGNGIQFTATGDIDMGTNTITDGKVAQWNTAYGWGDHSQEGYLKSYNDEYTTGATFNGGNGIVTFTRNDGDTYTVDLSATLSEITITGGTYNDSNQTLTLVKSDGNTVDVTGFAIESDVNFFLTGATFNSSNGVITYKVKGSSDVTVDIDGRYLTSYTETDPIFTASPSAGITDTDISNWNTAYGWGDHSLAGYVTSSGNTIIGTDSDINTSGSYVVDQLTMTDGVITNHSTRQLSELNIPDTRAAEKTPNEYSDKHLSLDFTDEFGSLGSWYSGLTLKGWTGTYSAWQLISEADSGVGDTNLYFRQGNNTTWQSMRTVWTSANFADNSSNWNTAYGWGDHSQAGYITGYSETDTLDSVTDRGSSTSNSITVGGVTTTQISTPTDTNLKLYPNGTGHLYLGDSSNGMNMYHYSQANDGKYTTFTHNGNYYRISPTATSGLEITSNTKVTGILTLGSGSTGSPYDGSTFLHTKGSTRSIIQQSSTDDAYYMFGDAAANNVAWVGYNHSSGTLDLHAETAISLDKDTTIAGDITILEDLYATNQNLKFHAGGTHVMNIDVNGKVYPAIHNAYDIGHSTSLAWRNLYLSGTVTASGGNSGNWNTAYGWGDHSLAGYITGYSEVDTLDSVTDRGATTSNNITVGYIGVGGTNPSWPLDVKGADTDNSTIARFYSNTGSRGSFIIRNGSGVSPTTFIGTAGGSEQLSIGTNNTEAIRLDASQNTRFVGGVIIEGGSDRITAEGSSMFLGGGNGNTTLIQFSGKAIPDSDKSHDLGQTNRYWKNAYIDVITATGGNSTNWNTAYGWDDHSTQGYLTSSSTQSKYLRSDTDDTTTGALTIGDGGNQARLILKKADNNTANHIEFYNGTTRVGEIGAEDDTWLRINQETSKNIYTPRYIRADGGFFVDSTGKGINGSGNFIGGTIGGASDANVTNWDTAYGWGDHSVEGYLTSYTETDTLSTVTARGRKTHSNGSKVWDATTPGRDEGNIHLMSIATDHSGGAITFNASDNNAGHAGIYVKSDGSYGTKMYIATTDSYAAGSKTAISIDHSGYVNITRGSDRLQVNGNRVHHAGDFSTTDVANGVTAYGWGDHSIAGYTGDQDLSGYATQTYVGTQIDNLIDSSPGTLDTLNELAAALGDDPNFATTITNSIATKLPLAGGVMSGNIGRSAHNKGYLVGGYNNVGASASATNPIFTIGTNYLPAVTTLGNMYGIGYTRADASFMGVASGSGWGMYVAADGDARIWLDGSTGNIVASGTLSASGYNDSNWNTAYGWGDHSVEGYLTSESYTAHEDTSTLNGNYGGGNNGVVVEDITVDSNGHVTAVGTRDLDGRFMLQGQELSDPDTISNGGNRYNPNSNNPTNEHYAILTYGNGGNVTGQLATHFQTGDLYSRGYNSSWSTWKKYFNTDDFTTTNVSNWNTAYGWGDHASGGYAADNTVVKLTGDQSISGTKKFAPSSLVIEGTHGTISFMDTSSAEDNFYIHVNSNNFYVLADRDGTDAIDGGYETPHPLQLEGDTNKAYVFGTELTTSNWNTAYGWGDHSVEGYITSTDGGNAGLLDGLDSTEFLRSNADDSYNGDLEVNGMFFKDGSNVDRNFKMQSNDSSGTDVGISLFNAAGAHTIQLYGTTSQYGFLDGNWASWDIRKTKNGAFEVDEGSGLKRVWNEGIFANNSGNWNTAYGWGDHAGAGYITSPDGGNAGLLDGLDSTQFLRSDTADTFTSTITMGTQKALVANNYGRGVYGIYSATRYQHVWGMGTAYNLSDDGTASGNFYGIAYTHTNMGGESKSGLSHQALFMTGGVTRTAIGTGIWTQGTITTGSHGTSSNWNTAYGWGDHANAGYLNSLPTHNHAATEITSGTFAAARFANSTRYNIGLITGYSSQSRDKLRVWDSSEYSIGMKSGYDYGHIGSGEYAMSFQMSNTDGRGWWWGDTSHSDDQGAASLTTTGKMVIAKSLSVGQGELITNPSDTPLYVEGTTAGETVFEVQGTSGQLFSITDDLTGDIFEVSDISGIPILTVNSSGVVTVDDTLHVTGDVIAYYASDKRLKDNIKPIENAIDKIKMIGGYEFDWNLNSRNNKGHDVGVIAQEIEEVLPELVGTRSDGYKGVKYEKLTALLIQSNKELIARVEELESKLKK